MVYNKEEHIELDAIVILACCHRLLSLGVFALLEYNDVVDSMHPLHPQSIHRLVGFRLFLAFLHLQWNSSR